jgi:hypothetical protein
MASSRRPRTFWPLALVLPALVLSLILAPARQSARAAPPPPAAALAAPDTNLMDAGASDWLAEPLRSEPVHQMRDAGRRFLRVDAQGRSHMVFGGDGLYYARQEGDGWHVETVETADNVGHGAALAFDSRGYPVIGYCDDTGPSVKLARWTGDYWRIDWVEAVAKCQRAGVVVDGEDEVHLLYAADVRREGGDPISVVRYATEEGGRWRAETLYDATNFDVALAGDELRAIVWGTASNAIHHGAKRVNGWEWEKVVDAPPVSGWADSWIEDASLAVDGQGRSAIAYVGGTWRKFYDDDYYLAYLQQGASGWEGLGGFEPMSLTARLTFDSAGRPAILYRSWYAREGYLRWDGSAWIDRPVERPAGGRWGQDVAADGEGGIRAAYLGSDAGIESVVHASESAGAWMLETVAAAQNVAARSARGEMDVAQGKLAYAADGQVYFAEKAGDRWEILPVGADPSNNPLMAIGPDGEVWIAYIAGSRLLQVAHRGAGGWTNEVAREELMPRGAAPFSLAVSADGRPRVLYFTERPWRLMLSERSDAGEWSSSIVKEFNSWSYYDWAWTALALDAGNRPRIVYALSEPGVTILRYAAFDGATWAVSEIDTQPGWVRPSLQLDAHGTPHLAYQAGTEPRYATLLNGRWTRQTPAPNEPPYSDTLRSLSLVVDRRGRPHVAYVLSGDWYWPWNVVRHAVLDRGEWQADDVALGGIYKDVNLDLDEHDRAVVTYHDGRAWQAREAPRRFAPLCAPDDDAATAQSGAGRVERVTTRCSYDAHVRLGGHVDLYTSERYVRTGGAGVPRGEGEPGYVAGLVFPDLGIPQGAVITSARLILSAWQDRDETVALEIAAEKGDAGAGFGPGAGWPHERARTALRSQWRVVPRGRVESPDLSAVVQEAVSEPEWNANASLALLLRPLTGVQPVADWAGSAVDEANAPQLVVEWRLPARHPRRPMRPYRPKPPHPLRRWPPRPRQLKPSRPPPRRLLPPPPHPPSLRRSRRHQRQPSPPSPAIIR